MPEAMVKSVALSPKTVGLLVLIILTLAVVTVGPVTVHAKLPVLVPEDGIMFHVAPESRDTSILTPLMEPTEVQVIFWVLPTGQLSPPLGATMVIAGGSALVMVKSASLVSDTEGKYMLETITLAWVVTGPCTNHI
jgi:hypothetical protein